MRNGCMSSTDSPTLHVEIGHRRVERRLTLLILSCGCLAPFLFQPLELLPRALLSTAAGLMLWTVIQPLGWLGGPRRITGIQWSADGAWLLRQADGQAVEATLHPGTRVWPFGVWLRWREGSSRKGRGRALFVTLTEAPELRRFAVRLRVESGRTSRGVMRERDPNPNPRADRAPDANFARPDQSTRTVTQRWRARAWLGGAEGR